MENNFPMSPRPVFLEWKNYLPIFSGLIGGNFSSCHQKHEQKHSFLPFPLRSPAVKSDLPATRGMETILSSWKSAVSFTFVVLIIVMSFWNDPDQNVAFIPTSRGQPYKPSQPPMKSKEEGTFSSLSSDYLV